MKNSSFRENLGFFYVKIVINKKTLKIFVLPNLKNLSMFSVIIFLNFKASESLPLHFGNINKRVCKMEKANLQANI
jgi:hypothetical protein